jgi:hypothetical protein
MTRFLSVWQENTTRLKRGSVWARSLRGRRTAAAMREKPVHFEITDCAQGTTLGLSLLPNCPRLSHISLRGLLPRRLLAVRRVVVAEKRSC